MKRLILTACVLALGSGSSFAGPLQRLLHRGGQCSACQSATGTTTTTAPPVSMPVATPAPAVVYQTSYAPPLAGPLVMAEPTATIRLGVPVPMSVCVGGSCGR